MADEGATLACPRDGSPLQARTQPTDSGPFETHICPTCRGLTVDAYSLERLDHGPSWPILEELLQQEGSRGPPCPRCPGRATRALETGGVEIDLCARCHSLWLDPGELTDLRALDPEGGPATVACPDAGTRLERATTNVDVAAAMFWLVADLGELLADLADW